MKITEISPYFLRYFPEYGEITENYGDAKIRRNFPKKTEISVNYGEIPVLIYTKTYNIFQINKNKTIINEVIKNLLSPPRYDSLMLLR